MVINMANQNDITIGTVVSIDDPNFKGRIKVLIPGYNDNEDVSNMNWCEYGGGNIFSGNGGGSISIARVGQKVRVRARSNDPHAELEWYAINELDKDLISELSQDYANSHFLIYDSANDITVKYQTVTGLVLYYKGSFIQIAPDNTITLHYGLGVTGTQIQLSEDRIDIQSGQEINLTTPGTINLEADVINLNAKGSIQMKGNNGADCTVNAAPLMSALSMLASIIDAKAPQSTTAEGIISQYKPCLMNDHITTF